MAYDLEEQEQIDTLKAWWKQYGNVVTWLLVIALTGYAAWTLWNVRQRDQSQQASQIFENLKKASADKDIAKVKVAAAELSDKFANTAYATMAALAVAKASFVSGDLKEAKTQLQWVFDHTKVAEFKAIARIRLAGIALDEKSFDTALVLLNADMPTEFAGDAAERKGDIYLAQNKIPDARSAYQSALEKVKENSQNRQLIQLKLDAIGGSVETKSAAISASASAK